MRGKGPSGEQLGTRLEGASKTVQSGWCRLSMALGWVEGESGSACVAHF